MKTNLESNDAEIERAADYKKCFALIGSPIQNIHERCCLSEASQIPEEKDSFEQIITEHEVCDRSHGNEKEVALDELAIIDQNKLKDFGVQRTDLYKNDGTSSELNLQSGSIRYDDDNDLIESSECKPIDNKPEFISQTADPVPPQFEIPFVEIKELDKIRPLPVRTEEDFGAVSSTTSNNLSVVEQDNAIDSACVESLLENGSIQQDFSSGGQIECYPSEVHVGTTDIDSQVDFESEPLSTHGPSICVEDNEYIDDSCKHELALPDQASTEQTSKQTIIIELHLLRRKSKSIADAISPTVEEPANVVSSEKITEQPLHEDISVLPQKSLEHVEDLTVLKKDSVDVAKVVDIPLEKSTNLRNVEASDRLPNDRKPSNYEISGSLESVASDKTKESRRLSVHEKRVLDSLKNLQLPEWYKKSDVHKRKMKNMAEGKVLRSDSGTVYGQNSFYSRPKSSSFGSDSDCSSTKSISTRMSYERKAKYYYSAQHLAMRSSPSDEYRNKAVSSSYLKTQSNYDIHRLAREKDKTTILNSGHSDDIAGQERLEQSRITERPQSESDLVNMDPIPMNNFKIQRQRSNKGTATFYITSVHVENKDTKQKETNCSNPIRGSYSGVNGGARRENNNEIEKQIETNNSVHNNRDDSYPDEVKYKHNPYTYKLVYGTPQTLKEGTADDTSTRHETSPESTEFYKESDHVEYYASIVRCGEEKVSDQLSDNQGNLSPDITNDSAINLDNMSSGQDSESFRSYEESAAQSDSLYVPSITHSAPPHVEHKKKHKPSAFPLNSLTNLGSRNVSSSYDDVLKQKSDSLVKSGKGRTSPRDSGLGSKNSPRFPVINRSRDNLLANGKKNGLSISITDTRLDDSHNNNIDEEEFEKRLHESDRRSDSEDKEKAVVMENIIDGLLGLTTASLNNSSNFSYNESAQSSSSLLPSSESDSSSVMASARRKQNDAAKKQTDTTTDDKTHVVHCRKCRTSANLEEAKKSFKNCHHCYTYYCSRDCRIEHWEQHKQRCIFARVSSSCKRAIAVCRDDGSTHYTLSKIARTCFLSHGRGSILIVFPNEIAARLFFHYGLRAVPSPPSYITVRELEKTQEPNEHTHSLLSVCQEYDPNTSFIINIIVNIGMEIPKKPVPRRQGTAIKKCARFSLCETHVAKPNTRANETTGETLILTMPPGLPPDGTRDRKLRQVCFVNIQRHLRQREVKLRHQFPAIYSALCRWVEYHESFPPTTIYPKEGNTNRPFMCLIMPESDPDALGWVTNPGLLDDIDMDGEFE
ncbi:uncharacterized protein [Antedon mediterranea]|uniref:uncharacterized protein n=1 Tax=Antedon mediterranea TaxID=105859 RepID=UPI003AF64391